MKKLLFFLLLGGLIGGCKMCSQKKSSKEQLMEGIDKVDTASASIARDRISRIIRSIPSPLELSVMIKKSGADFNQELLHKTSNVESYTTNFNKAVNLGVYGTDLGYLILYDQTQLTINYLKSVRALASDLKVDQFFDFNTIHRLAEHRGNTDSLIYITTSGFEEMSDYLKEQNRSALSVIMLTSGWLEALHLASQSAIASGSQKLMNRVGEQKLTLNEVLILCGAYRNNKKIGELFNALKKLQKAFQEITISYKKGKIKKVEKGNTIYIKDMSTSTVEINTAQLKKIARQTKIIRNKLL